jgi:outer membrane protein assembly factor BamB
MRMPARHRLFSALMLGVVFFVSRAEAAEEGNWPQWRGPTMTGAVPSADPATTWAEDKNVRWKVKLPGEGTSTPIIWGDQIFIETAIDTGKKADGAAADPTPAPPAPPPPPAGGGGGGGGGRRGGGGRGGMNFNIAKPTTVHKFDLVCIDRKTGKTAWEKTLREEVPHEGHHPDHGFASYSPVTDGQHVWAFFGSRGLHCLDMAGNIIWQKDLGKMQTRLTFGEGSSPALFGDTVVVLWDHEGDDWIAAFNKLTGDELWRQPRNEDMAWTTPLIVDYQGQQQVIVNSAKKVRSYDLKTGKEVWESPGLTAANIPTPVASDGMVYCMSDFMGAALYAIHLGHTGDLTGTDAIAWSAKRGTPYVPSPLLYGERLYFYSNNNPILSCYDVKAGKPIVETQRIDDIQGVYASPVGASGRVYLLGRDGNCVVIKHLDQTDKIEVLATNKLDDRFDASPALVGKEMFLRGKQNLYCIAGE